MKISIVTISYNQAQFLERTIRSVVEQDYQDIEYIVVDAGSTDGSREIIERYQKQISKVILEPDKGPADGLNKGFAVATGDLYGFLNSDDILLPDALKEVVQFFEIHPEIDVVSAHSLIIDRNDKVLLKGFSGRFSLHSYAYYGVGLMQASTFFRRKSFLDAGGFNEQNTSSWDGELWVDMAQQGARFALINAFWSGFRLHPQSITTSKRLHELINKDHLRIFHKIIGRKMNRRDSVLRFAYRVFRHIRDPRAFMERVLKGPISGRGQ